MGNSFVGSGGGVRRSLLNDSTGGGKTPIQYRYIVTRDQVATQPGQVLWTDIGGQDEASAALAEAVECL